MALCCRPGCGRLAYGNQPGNYCTRGCRDGTRPSTAPQAVLCATPGCGQPAFGGVPGNSCCKSCRDGRGCSCTAARPATSRALQPAASPGGLRQVDAKKFQELKDQFESRAWSGRPVIDTIWDVHDPQQVQGFLAYASSIGNVARHGAGVNPGNQQRRFHSTTLECDFKGQLCGSSTCAVCSIIKSGFDFGRIGSATGSRFGAGVYSTATPEKAFGYSKGKKSMFVVGVAAGNADVSTSSGPLPAGYHSRVVPNTLDELVVFSQGAIIPKYLIIFK